MKRYQIVSKPLVTASGDAPRWKMWAHGATLSREEADSLINRHKALGYVSRKLPL
jgi:hypothetical protein